jgi:plastocyanin
MGRLLAAASVFVAVAIAGPATAADQTITITTAGFVPRDVTITAGESVTWTNADTRAHQVTVDRTPCSVTVQPASSATCTLRTPGRFTYRDSISRGNAWRGTITVRRAVSVTIAASPRTVVYRRATTLSGSVSSSREGERVTVQQQVCGSSTVAPVATVVTTTGGAWTLVVRPLKHTTYQARWSSAPPSTAAVRVRPRLTLRKLTRGRLALRVASAESFAGRTTVLQRFHVGLRRWVRVRYVVLAAMGGTAPTVVSGRNVRVNVRVGTRLRFVIGQRQVGSCYLPGTSNVVRR